MLLTRRSAVCYCSIMIILVKTMTCDLTHSFFSTWGKIQQLEASDNSECTHSSFLAIMIVLTHNWGSEFFGHDR